MSITKPFAAIVLLGALALSTVVQAGTIRHDVNDSVYTNLANDPRYQSVGLLNLTGFYCSGTLVASSWVLTAAHCVDKTPTSFNIGGSSYSAASWFSHSGWTGDLTAGNDIGLVRLASEVTGISFASLYTGSSEVGQTATYVGYGTTGTGVTGNTQPGGTKRAGHNIFDIDGSSVSGYSANILFSDFDHPDPPNAGFPPYIPEAGDITLGSPTALDWEYLIAGGDSGGGAFIDMGATTYLAGVNSFVAYNDSTFNSDYEDASGVTKVSAYADWINAAIASDMPAPASLTMLLLGLAGLGACRRLSEA